MFQGNSEKQVDVFEIATSATSSLTRKLEANSKSLSEIANFTIAKNKSNRMRN